MSVIFVIYVLTCVSLDCFLSASSSTSFLATYKNISAYASGTPCSSVPSLHGDAVAVDGEWLPLPVDHLRSTEIAASQQSRLAPSCLDEMLTE